MFHLGFKGCQALGFPPPPPAMGKLSHWASEPRPGNRAVGVDDKAPSVQGFVELVLAR